MPFVSFEGVDGGGKSTQLRMLAEWLESEGQIVVRTREPGGGRLGADICSLLTSERGFSLDAVEELLLIGAARYDHVRSVINPAVALSHWVLADRFFDSTFALQVHGADAPLELFHAVTSAVVGKTRPDLTFILDLSPEEALARRNDRGVGSADPAESSRDFKRIRDGFRILADLEPRRCRLVDANMSPKMVGLAIQQEILAAGLLNARVIDEP